MGRSVVVVLMLSILIVIDGLCLSPATKPSQTLTANSSISPVSTSLANSSRPPSISLVLARLNSYSSFCWIVEGNSLTILGMPAERVKGCVNYANSTAVYWVEKTDGWNFTYTVSSNIDGLEWSVVTNSVWPEVNIVNFLRRILQNGNVTWVKKQGDVYEFRVSFRHEEVSNAGTIENPKIIRAVEIWNVTVVVKDDGEPLGGYFIGKIVGGSAGVPRVHKGNFTILMVRS